MKDYMCFFYQFSDFHVLDDDDDDDDDEFDDDALFPAATIVRDPHHRESLARLEQGLSLRRA